MSRSVTISSNSRVTISLVLSLVGGIAWLTNLHFVTTATAKALEEFKEQQVEEDREVTTKLDSVLGRLSKMEGQLSVIYQFQVKKGAPRVEDDSNDSDDHVLPRVRRRK